MRLTFLTIILLFFLPIVSLSQPNHHLRPVIFDSDMGPDYDDVGAITLLHAFADSGRASILATIASTKYEGVAGVFYMFKTKFKKNRTPAGVLKREGGKKNARPAPGENHPAK